MWCKQIRCSLIPQKRKKSLQNSNRSDVLFFPLSISGICSVFVAPKHGAVLKSLLPSYWRQYGLSQCFVRTTHWETATCIRKGQSPHLNQNSPILYVSCHKILSTWFKSNTGEEYIVTCQDLKCSKCRIWNAWLGNVSLTSALVLKSCFPSLFTYLLMFQPSFLKKMMKMKGHFEILKILLEVPYSQSASQDSLGMGDGVYHLGIAVSGSPWS